MQDKPCRRPLAASRVLGRLILVAAVAVTLLPQAMAGGVPGVPPIYVGGTPPADLDEAGDAAEQVGKTAGSDRKEIQCYVDHNGGPYRSWRQGDDPGLGTWGGSGDLHVADGVLVRCMNVVGAYREDIPSMTMHMIGDGRYISAGDWEGDAPHDFEARAIEPHEMRDDFEQMMDTACGVGNQIPIVKDFVSEPCRIAQEVNKINTYEWSDFHAIDEVCPQPTCDNAGTVHIFFKTSVRIEREEGWTFVPSKDCVKADTEHLFGLDCFYTQTYTVPANPRNDVAKQTVQRVCDDQLGRPVCNINP